MRIKILFACLTCTSLWVSSGFAQEDVAFAQGNTSKDKKLSISEQTQLEQAQYLYEQKNYRLALPLFESILAKHPGDTRVKYFAALCYVSRPDKCVQMLQYLTEVYTANKKADKIEYELAKAYFFNYKFKDAAEYLDLYTSKLKKPSTQQQKEIDQLSGYLKNAKALAANPLSVQITNLGRVVNTKASECSPYTNLSDTMLVYTYRGELSKGGLLNAYGEPDKNGVYYEDVFTTTKVNGVWTTPYPVMSVNSDNNDEALSISYDGKSLFISRDSPEDDGDIYMSTLVNNQWETPLKLMGGVNSPGWEDNCSLAPDGKTLFFSSSRAGGYGGKDLYKSILQFDGTWGAAINLGDKINTPEDEDDPFFHLDGRLFLFSSKGHNSMGGYDIFKTYLNPVDSTWSAVENIGYPINTPDDDIHYSISPGGDKGYYSISRPDGFGDNDLYTVEPGITGIMPAMVVVKGLVSFDKHPFASQIEVLTANGLYKKYKSDSVSGFYQIVLPLGQDYKITWRLNDTTIQTETVEALHANAYLLKIRDVVFKTKEKIADTVVAVNPVAHANTAAEDKPVVGLVYKIQIAAYCLNKNIDYSKLKEYGEVEKKTVRHIDRFMMNKEYHTLSETSEPLKELKKIVTPAAFVIGFYKGKRLYIHDLRKQGIIPEEKK